MTDKQCNICGGTVEIVGNAASQCGNNRCKTHEDNPLSTDSTAEDLAYYWRERARECEKGLSRDSIEENALAAFEDYIHAESRTDAEDAEIRADVYLSHTDKGWGWLKEQSDAI